MTERSAPVTPSGVAGARPSCAPPAVPRRDWQASATVPPPEASVVEPDIRRRRRRPSAVVVQLFALAAIIATSAVTLHVREAQASADLAADQGAGPRIPFVRPAIRYAAPVSVLVPRLRIHSSLIDLHTLPNGALQVPVNPAQAGWYVGSAHPGDAGPTVIAGHVDSYKGPGVFYHLDHLKPGDKIVVGRSDGSRASFTVTRVMQVAKRAFPTALVYRGTRPSLRLISCGGDFDRQTGHYLDDVIVLASPTVATHPIAQHPSPVAKHRPELVR